MNKDERYLPNITVGYHVFDTCGDPIKSSHDTLHILSGQKNVAPNFSCLGRGGEVAGFVGDNVVMEQLLGLYGYTKISYDVTDPLPDRNDDLFSSFFRISQYDKLYHVAVALLMRHFGWNWVGVIVPNDDSGDTELRKMTKELTRRGICIEVVVKTAKTIDENERKQHIIKKSTANVFVICGQFSVMYHDWWHLQKFSDKTLIFNDSWFLHQQFHLNYRSLTNCSLTFAPVFKWKFAKIPRVKKLPNDPFLKALWGKHCSNVHEKYNIRSLYKDVFITLSCADGWNPFHLLFQQDVTEYYTFTAVSVLLYALHDMHVSLKRNVLGSKIHTGTYRHQLKYFVRRVDYIDETGERISFDETRYLRSKPMLSLNNWVHAPIHESKKSEGNYIYVNESLPEEEWLHINDKTLVWRTSRVPFSRCNERCPSGYGKIPKEGIHLCCYGCAPCPEGEFSNTESEKCQKCPDDQQPNKEKSKCLPKTYEFLSYEEDFIAFIFSAMAVICSGLTLCIIKLFIAHWDSSVVKANNRTVSFILLTSILLSFLCVFLFLGRPVDITCVLRQVLYGICFSIALSSVLAKTIQLCITFKATKPNTFWRNWAGNKEFDMFSYPGKIIIQCNEGSVIGFYSVLGYLGFLAAVSFVLAFMVRTLPDSFNEAKYITFSMLVFCSVWIAMIPAYLSTRGKYMECDAHFSDAGKAVNVAAPCELKTESCSGKLIGSTPVVSSKQGFVLAGLLEWEESCKFSD
ncbi:vomeronasal type-2 receptor 26-like [Hyperolius riggenbachi]|uniref:vomeronasal type-2 receptor 26-like n=1 Tax=Hyperolius riggenbachi TaxID=752182 RepID=UPI0035A2BE9B